MRLLPLSLSAIHVYYNLAAEGGVKKKKHNWPFALKPSPDRCVQSKLTAPQQPGAQAC